MSSDPRAAAEAGLPPPEAARAAPPAWNRLGALGRAGAAAASAANEVPRPLWLVVAVQTIFSVGLLFHGNPLEHPNPTLTVIGVVFAFFPSLAAVYWIDALLANYRWPRFAALLLAFVLLAMGNVIVISADGKADFGFLRENAHELRDGAAFDMIASVVEVPTRITFFAELLGVGFFLWAPAPRPLWQAIRRQTLAIGAALTMLAAVAWASFVPSFDSIVLLGHSAYHYYLPLLEMDRVRARDPRPYPDVHEFKNHPLDGVTLRQGERPNVIVVLMESFNGLYLNRTAHDGKPYTPNMNEALTKGLAVTHFYGNSVQTCRGHFAAMCSLVPSYRGKEHTFDPLNLDCLPDVLERHGYRTYFYTGANDPEFDDQIPFAKAMGFSVAECTAKKKRQPESEKPFVWGWGLQDDHFYPWAFDQLEHAGGLSGKEPFFMVLAPVSNHYPFKDEPDFIPLRGESTSKRRRYAASLRNSDLRMQKLFDVMAEHGLGENTIVVYTGDHSFPSDEHGYHWNERGAHEENFRVPFVIQWPGHVAPRTISDRAASQIDLAPTVLDLLRIEDKVSFVGRSLFDPDPSRPFVPLVQPYDGVHLGAVEWPFKVLTRLSTGDTEAYDLASDPEEKRPLRLRDLPADAADAAKDAIGRIHFNQSLFETNQFWPDPGQKSVVHQGGEEDDEKKDKEEKDEKDEKGKESK